MKPLRHTTRRALLAELRRAGFRFQKPVSSYARSTLEKRAGQARRGATTGRAFGPARRTTQYQRRRIVFDPMVRRAWDAYRLTRDAEELSYTQFRDRQYAPRMEARQHVEFTAADSSDTVEFSPELHEGQTWEQYTTQDFERQTQYQQQWDDFLEAHDLEFSPDTWRAFELARTSEEFKIIFTEEYGEDVYADWVDLYGEDHNPAHYHSKD